MTGSDLEGSISNLIGLLSQHISGGWEKSRGPQTGYLVSVLRFEWAPLEWSQSVNLFSRLARPNTFLEISDNFPYTLL